MQVSLLVPHRAEEGTPRDRNWQWCRERWLAAHPDWELVVHPGDDVEPFSKTTAVNEAFKRSSGDVLVVSDSDTWMDADLKRATHHAYEHGVLVMPWKRAWRLHREPSDRLLVEGPGAELGDAAKQGVKGPHAITAAMCYVISRDSFIEVNGMDPRFRGYRFEDVSFRRSCDYILGRGRYLYDDCYSLFHERPRRETIRGSAVVWGSEDGGDDNRWLNTKYIKARSPSAMRALVDEHDL